MAGACVGVAVDGAVLVVREAEDMDWEGRTFW